MSAAIVDVSNRVLTFRVSGQLKHSELVAAQQQAAELIRQQGKVKFLVLVEDFLGTEKAGDWGDVSFQAQNDRYIEKIALVGEKKLEDLTLLFVGKGVRRVQIEYFPPAELAAAKAWLAAV